MRSSHLVNLVDERSMKRTEKRRNIGRLGCMLGTAVAGPPEKCLQHHFAHFPR